MVGNIPETDDSLAFLTIFRDKFQVEEGYKTLDRSQECVEVRFFNNSNRFLLVSNNVLIDLSVKCIQHYQSK